MEKAKLTKHALMRLNERTSISSQSLCVILNDEEFVSLGKEKDSNRLSKLFFSREDGKFYIAIQDEENGYVVTILTLRYWHNLSEKFFEKKLSVTRNELLNAIKIGDPSNLVLKHPPLTSQNIFSFRLVIFKGDSLKNRFKHINAGGIDVKLFINTPTKDLANIIKVEFIKRIVKRKVDNNYIEMEIDSVHWGAGSDFKDNYIKCYKKINYNFLVDAVKNDLYLRNNLFKKYDDFLEILNRRKKIFSNYDI